jgi:hypothetical protein
MQAKINDHPESCSGVQPCCAPLIPQSEQGARHYKKRLYGSDFTPVQCSTQELSDTLAEGLTSRSAIATHLETWAEL